MLFSILAGFVLFIQPKPTPNLPRPGKSTILVPKLYPAPTNFLKAAKGWTVDLFTAGLTHPRKIAIAPNGDVFVVETRIEVPGPQPHDTIVLSGFDKAGRPTQRFKWSDELNMPFGIQFAFGHLYVGNTDSIVRWPYKDGDREASGKPELILSGIPNDGYRNHWTRNILFDKDRTHLWLTIGSEGNIAEEGPRRAVIERYRIDTAGKIIGSAETYAKGMRNPIGLAQNPVDGRLWANVAERDYKGDELVPDYFTSVKPGGFYGWPYCYIGQHHDTKMPRKPELEKTTIVPDVLFPAHTTPIDVVFIKEGAVVTLHGTQNRSRLMGYKAVLVPFKGGKPSGPPQDLLTGWLPAGSNKKIYGRPAGIAIMRDGSLLVVDDWGGKIWRLKRTS